ncbi:MAG TPA: flagellar biosynthesis anti-sigma factor FlgM [Syntrophales bacterium]|nr:flagellar biosynthesis anti-sigma factor FlgM [Syntrophales bacterium]HOL60033.1 flagellar biosynthesis anti-sigma factor FlgM [Syntrophales bacterium]
MKITGRGELQNEALQKYQPTDAVQKGKVKGEKAESPGLVPEDKVSISAQSRDINIARGAIENLPEIREDRVAEIKKAVESGTYQVDADKLADKLALDSLVNIFV